MSTRQTVALDLPFEEGRYIFSDVIKPQIVPGADYAPIEPSSLFDNDNPVNVEIGIGNGEFLCEMAARHPEQNYIGFEVVKKIIRKAVSRARRMELTNVRIIHYDALFFVHLMPENSLAGVYVNFPDPWPKKRHHKRRILKTGFITYMAERITPGGSLYMVTDDPDYAADIVEQAEPVPILANPYDAAYITDMPEEYIPTKYYRKFVPERGVHFFRRIRR